MVLSHECLVRRLQGYRRLKSCLLHSGLAQGGHVGTAVVTVGDVMMGGVVVPELLKAAVVTWLSAFGH